MFLASLLMPDSWMMGHCGSVSDIAAALTIIEKEGPEHGLCLNRSKCLIHMTKGVHISYPSLCHVPVASGGFDLQGTPVGPAAVLHTCPPELIFDALGCFDDSMREAFSDLAGQGHTSYFFRWPRASQCFPPCLGSLYYIIIPED